MKKAMLLIFLLTALFCVAQDQPVNQEIRYVAKHASEVYLVWGVNNWQVMDKDELPPGSYIKDDLVHTLMTEKESGVFSVDIKVKSGTMIDYTFWITKGPRGVPSDVWDTNTQPQKDYHTMAINDNIAMIDSKKEIQPKQQLTLLNFAWPLLIGILIMALVFYIVKKYRFKGLRLNPGPLKIILGGGGITLAVLLLIRASVSLMSWKLYYQPIEFFPQVLYAGFYDHLYVISYTLFFVLLVFLFKKRRKVQYVFVSMAILVNFISIIAGILNIRMMETMGKPFNFRWLYYSGFLKSSEAKSAMASNISMEYILNVVAVCCAAVIAGVLIVYAIEWFMQKVRIRKVAFVIFVLVNLCYVFFAKRAISVQNWEYDRLANPVTAFLESISPFTKIPQLYTMNVPDSLRTFGNIKADYKMPEGFPAKIRNVLVVVLESTPAEYLQPYDTLYNLTPELKKQLTNAIVFDNIYAHAPATNKSMVSLLGSVYPWLSYESLTQEHPNINIPTLSSKLKDKGYRTAFFNSGDSRFQKADEFLSFRKFDEMKDCKNLPCKLQFSEQGNKWDPLDGIDDECAADALITWMKKDRSKPFFGMLWTYQTHYPYYPGKEEKDYVIYDTVLNRYMNAVNHSDMVLGKILKQLKANGLSKSTLVVVVGDHGEAFGRHDQITHGSKIYEENLHIPLIFINPGFKAERKEQIGGMIDVAPTIMAMIGSEGAEEWQGENLFSPVRNNRTYFFCPWSDYLYGYREGNKKYIYNASKDLTEIYDLKKDPFETQNIATPSETEICHAKLAAWIQYHNKFMNAALAPKKNTLISLRKTEHSQ
mgnify:CR=1 FL=1